MRISDRIYGQIILPKACAILSQTKAFQRLEFIKQLGGCSLVYPSATHTRREHSLGVCYLAGEFAKQIKLFIDMSNDEILCVQIAGLLHDIGHGPFSHLFEEFVCERISKEWSHEVMSVKIVEYLFANLRSQLEPEFDGCYDEQLALVKAMILGAPLESVGAGKQALFRIVHCTTCGIDADRLDYLQRDNVAVFGATNVFDIRRIVSSILVINGEIVFHERISFEISD